MKILYLVSHVGLGHVTRARVVADEIRRIASGAKVEWCTSEPARTYLSMLDENLVECCKELRSLTESIEKQKRLFSLGWMLRNTSLLYENYEAIKDCIDWDSYDYILADEFWEIVLPSEFKRDRVVFITDLLAKPYNLSGLISSLVFNRFFKRRLQEFKRVVYANTRNNIPKFRWFWVLGERVSEWAAKSGVVAVGKMPGVNPRRLISKHEARARLGLGDEKIVVVLVGGTSTANQGFLDLVEKAFEIAKRRLGDLKLIVVRGPRTKWKSKNPHIVLEGFKLDAWMYIIAADLVVSRAGRTTVAEIELVGTPAILVPIPGHFEQEIVATEARSSLIKVVNQNSKPGRLADEIVKLIGLKPRPARPHNYMGSLRLARLVVNGML